MSRMVSSTRGAFETTLVIHRHNYHIVLLTVKKNAFPEFLTVLNVVLIDSDLRFCFFL